MQSVFFVVYGFLYLIWFVFRKMVPYFWEFSVIAIQNGIVKFYLFYLDPYFWDEFIFLKSQKTNLFRKDEIKNF